MYYAGIGSRKTPREYINLFMNLAKILGKYNYTLRSGGAAGADSAFELGCDFVNGKKEIYLPWKTFNDNISLLYPPTKEAFDISSKFHPKWDILKHSHRLLHARNAHQILGKNCNTPCEFVLCWTPLDSGGTLQALRIASYYKIEIFNFYEKNTLEKFKEHMYVKKMLS